MNKLKIEKKIKNYNFLCLGACHSDNILKLKNNYKLFRTNPVIYESKKGGVCFNIVNYISLFTKNFHFFSLSIPKNVKKTRFHNISKNKNDSFYTAILDQNGKLIMGLASNESYEKINKIKFDIINKYIKSNTFLILDLCFNKKLTENIINYYFSKKINIMIAGTSSFKINRIKNCINKISTLCLNEDEAFALTNKKSINYSINYILKKNPIINLVITRGKKPVIMVLNGVKYLGYVPKIRIKNENGAGDAFSAMFFLCVTTKLQPFEILSLSISLGCLHTLNYKYKNIIDFNNKLKKIQKKIIIKKND